MKDYSRKQNILSEDINRMRQIMGLLPINEAASVDPFKPFFKGLRSIVRTILKPQELEEITQTGERRIAYYIADRKVAKETYDIYKKLLDTEGYEFKNAYEAFTKKMAGESDEIFKGRLRNLLQILGTQYSDGLYEQFFKSWFKKTGDLFGGNLRSEKAFYKWMSKGKKEALDGGEEWDIRMWLKEKGVLDDDFDIEALAPEMEKRLSEFEENPLFFKPKVIKKSGTVVSPLTKDQIAYFKQFLKSRVTLWTTMFESFGKTLQDYEKTVLAYMERYADDLMRLKQANATSEEMDTLATAYSMKIATILRKAKAKFGEDALEILEDSGLPPEIIAKFRNNNDEFFKLFNELWEGVDDSLKTTILDSFKSSMKNFIISVGTLLRQIYTLKLKQAFTNLLNPNTNLGTWFWTKTWAGFDTLYQVAAKNQMLMKGGRNWTKFLVEASMWTAAAGAASYFIRVAEEIFIELVVKPLGKLATLLCETASNIVPSLMYKVNSETGEAESGLCLELREMSKYEREGWESAVMLFPDALADAWTKMIEPLGYPGLIAQVTPVVAQIKGFYERLPYTVFGLRPDVKPGHEEAEKKKEELKKKLEVDSDGTIILDSIQLPNSEEIELELPNQ